MDLELLAESIRGWEQRGQLHPGEGLVLGLHEPSPLEGAQRVGATGESGDALVERWAGEAWAVERRYPTIEEAADHAFDRLGSLAASRYWGPEAWAAIEAKVQRGARLRTAALLLWPEADLRPDRWALVARLDELGIDRAAYWVEGVDGFPAPDELVPQLRRADDGWVLGTEERGSHRELARCSDEADACRRLFRDLVGGSVVDMGGEHDAPTVVDRHRAAVRAALEAALAQLDPS